MKKTYIIAEAGVNHNGEEKLAFEMIQKAKEAGADAVKFQLFNADKLTTQTAEQADYQKKAFSQATSQHEMLTALELSHKSFEKLNDYAKTLPIDFIITPFDLESLDFITTLSLPSIKIGSGDITNGPLLLAASRTAQDIILSSGMSTLTEIEEALKIIAFGYFVKNEFPTEDKLHEVYSLSEAHLILKEKVTLLHCTSEYPAPFEEVNLKAMDTISAAFDLAVGFSDHTIGVEIPLAAVARGAKIIEKHFTLDKNLQGPDHKASIDVAELTSMCRGIRNIEQALGDGRKRPRVCEIKNRQLVRRALVANQSIACGEIFSADNLGIKRPNEGLSPMHYWTWLGKKSDKDYIKDEAIR